MTRSRETALRRAPPRNRVDPVNTDCSALSAIRPACLRWFGAPVLRSVLQPLPRRPLLHELIGQMP